MRLLTRYMTAIAATLLLVVAGSTASAASDSPQEESWGYIASPALSESSSFHVEEPATTSPIPDELHEGLWRLSYVGALDNVNSVV